MPKVAEKVEYIVITNLDLFCEQRLGDLVQKVPNAALVLATLFRKWRDIMTKGLTDLHTRLEPFEKEAERLKQLRDFRNLNVLECLMVFSATSPSIKREILRGRINQWNWKQ